MKHILSFIYRRCLGWSSEVTVPDRDSCLMCVAPHTSNWDFIYAILFDRSSGGRAHFMMKKSWFVWPLSLLFRWQGGVPIDRSSRHQITDRMAEEFRQDPHFRLAITPEGTRSPNAHWHQGIVRIATKAEVPIRLYVLDYRHKTVHCRCELWPTGDVEADMQRIKDYYSQFGEVARKPAKFIV
ncbi:MAG: 1-acyl-sn-glycerol-3-phosphate acyltransferase [Bacteroidaceae bacterium]|nr:1-acyl-sn-glycerol-3-phosphate acyltransferase [Bacteroidaceae bacterium]